MASAWRVTLAGSAACAAAKHRASQIVAVVIVDVLKSHSRNRGGCRLTRPPTRKSIRSSFTVKVVNRYFEDYVVGSVHEFGSIRVEEDEIISFGKRYVPMPYHTDRELAKKSIYGGLIASGWHTAGLMMRLYTDHYLSTASALGSPGVDELRWDKPVRPGDVLSLRVTVLETRRSASKPDRGIVRSFVEVLNQKREVTMSLKAINFIRSRRSLANK